MNKAIIFGANGQDGYYLTELLNLNNVEVIAISRTGNKLHGDVADFNIVDNLIKSHKPNYVFHLAANSTVNHNALFENYTTICTGTLNILESVKINCPNTRVFLSGSALQFKNVGLPINEETPFDPSSGYSVARIQATYAARYYRNAFGLKVYVGYFFNHDSPLRTERHVNQKIVSAVKRIQKGSSEKLELGNVEVRKEFNFAGDIIEAIWRLVNQDNVFEAVIGCGQAYSIHDWVKYCFEKINKNWQEYVTINSAFVADYDILVSKPDLIKNLGWAPKVDFYQLADMMNSTN